VDMGVDMGVDISKTMPMVTMIPPMDLWLQ